MSDRCQVCEVEVEANDGFGLHSPHDPECPGPDDLECTCDNWTCDGCCWECNDVDLISARSRA